MNKFLKFTEEERKILEQAFDIIDKLTDEANNFSPSVDWSSEEMKYHFSVINCSDFIYNGKEIENCYDVLSALADVEEAFFAIEKD